MSGNQGLNTNSAVGAYSDLAITVRGSDWYWTVCALMAVSTFAFMGLSYTKKKTHRIFHYTSAGITLVAAIAYFAMAADLGQTAIQAEFPRPGSMEVGAAGTRQIFWVRFVDYAITTPLILTNLFLTSSIPRPTMLATLLADELMVVCYLAGALTQTSYKWGFFVFGLFGYFFVVYSLMLDGRRYAGALGGAANKTFLSCAGLTVFIWFLYPIAWGVSMGGNVIHPDSEAIFFGILDIVSKIVVGFMLVFGHKKIDPAELGLNIREHTTLPTHAKHGSRRDHHGRMGNHSLGKGMFGHRGMGKHGAIDHHDERHHRLSGRHGMRSNNENIGYHDGRNDHHRMSDRHGMRNTNGVVDYNDGPNDRQHRMSGHRDAATGHHHGITGHGHDGVNHRDTLTGHNDETLDYREKVAGNQSGLPNHQRTSMGREMEHAGHHNRADRHYDDDSDYDREPEYQRRKSKPSGGGIFGLFKKKNRHDDRGHNYHQRDRSRNRDGYRRDHSPDGDEYYERERENYQQARRSRSRGDYDEREQSPLRGEHRTGQRSPNRGDYRREQRSPYPNEGHQHDARRSFPGDNRRSFPNKLGSRADGHRSFPGGEHFGDGRRSPLGGEAHDEGRRSAPMGNYNQDNRRHTPGAEEHIDTRSHQQNIRSIPGEEHAAANRRPIPGVEDNRNEPLSESRRSLGDFLPDNRHTAGGFQHTQSPNVNPTNSDGLGTERV